MGGNFYHFAKFSVHFNITDLVQHGIFIWDSIKGTHRPEWGFVPYAEEFMI